jgi:hypothetical protein
MLGAPKSAFGFVRSVLPADSTQLLFLSGVVCLTIAPHLNWWPSDLFGRTAQLGATWKILSFVASSLINFSGSAGYYLCFWPGKYPLRRILWWVCFPAILGFASSCGLIFHFARITADQFSSGPFSLWTLGVGSHFALFGLILIVLFASLLAFGIASLPLTLPEPSVFCSYDAASWRPAQAVIWMQLATVGPLEIVIGLLLSGLLYPLTYIHSLSHFILLVSKTLPVLSPITTVVVLVGLAVWITGTEGSRGLRHSLRLPWPESFAIALAFPVGIANIVSLAHYLIARADWAAQQVAKIYPAATSVLPSPSQCLFSRGACARARRRDHFSRDSAAAIHSKVWSVARALSRVYRLGSVPLFCGFLSLGNLWCNIS